MAQVQLERHLGDQVTVETRYDISSLHGQAKPRQQAVRSHLGIENSVHWVLEEYLMTVLAQ